MLFSLVNIMNTQLNYFAPWQIWARVIFFYVSASCRFPDTLRVTAVFFSPFSCVIAVSHHTSYFENASEQFSTA